MMKDKVAVVGVGCTKFGEHFDISYWELLHQAVKEAVEEAGIEFKDIDGAWLGTAFPDAGVWKGKSGMDLAEPLALFDIPVMRLSNYCATAGDAFRSACLAVLSGEHRIALAAGCEKLRDRAPRDSLVKMMVEHGHPFYQKGFTAAGTFATYATRHMYEFGVTEEDFALVSVKNHKNAVLNPKAHYRKAITVEDVMKSPMVAFPMRLLDCCPTTDGAAAAVVVRTEDAPRINPDYVLVKGQGASVSTGWDLPFFQEGYDFLSFRATQSAAKMAFESAGIKEPFKELDFAEVHDCFANVELLTYEDLGLCEQGKSKYLIREGVTERDGEFPVNVSGGLLSFGHPVGATGLRMIYELVRQLQGKAGERQLKKADIGLAHNIGGPGAVACVTILARP